MVSRLAPHPRTLCRTGLLRLTASRTRHFRLTRCAVDGNFYVMVTAWQRERTQFVTPQGSSASLDRRRRGRASP
jgi:hypothetical protein